MATHSVATTPFPDQQPGTAGLRRKVTVFQQEHYLANFLQAILDCAGDLRGRSLVAGGDGRYFNREALQIAAELAAGNGVDRLIVGQGGLLSTPAASLLIGHREAAGGLLLTASHNPGGPDGDFGIKFNTASGGQASERLTAEIFDTSRHMERYFVADIGQVDFDTPGERRYGPLTVEIVDPVADYATVMQGLFDFDRIGALLRTGEFACASMRYTRRPVPTRGRSSKICSVRPRVPWSTANRWRISVAGIRTPIRSTPQVWWHS